MDNAGGGDINSGERRRQLDTLGWIALGIAHDFNNVLTVISGLTELLSHEIPPSDEVTSLITGIRDQIVRATELTRDVMNCGRNESRSSEIISLSPWLERTIRLLRKALPHGVRLSFSHDEGEYFVKASSCELLRVITNLTINARDAIGAIGSVHFHLHRGFSDDGDIALLDITDSGCGIEDDFVEQIFEPFFTTKEASNGSGLGLYYSREIVRRIGGDIRVQSKPDLGSTFTILFPCLSAYSFQTDLEEPTLTAQGA